MSKAPPTEPARPDGDVEAAPGADVSTRTPARRRARKEALARGTCVGRYVVLDVLGSGGMGVVYRAYDPELDRQIALKVVRTPDSDPQRVLAEAQALARVSHPNVIAVHDVGTLAGAVFLAMELVEGMTLNAWRAATSPSRADIVDVFLAAGRGLAAAHQAGIVHRDFKPSNVMVGSDGRVRVLDFGLARAAGRAASIDGEATTTVRESPTPTPVSGSTSGSRSGARTAPTPSRSVTRPGGPRAFDDVSTETELAPGTPGVPQVLASRVMGTPSYMAPEQRRSGVYDARVDQYSFAVALYEALYGERPFSGQNREEVELAALTGRINPPTRGSDVPPWLRKVLVKALAADPRDRYPTMDDLLAALEADPAVRQRRILVGAGGAALIATAALAIATVDPSPAPCQGSERALAGVWDGDAAAAIARAFAATGRGDAADVHRRVVALLDRRAKDWAAMRRDACEATHVRGEQSAQLLDLRTACLDRRLAELGAVAGALARPPAPIDHAVDAARALPSVSACADREALLTAVPLPADAGLRARVAGLRRRMATADALVLTGAYATARDQAAAIVADAERTGYDPAIAEGLYLLGRAAGDADDDRTAEDALYRAATRAARGRDDALAAAAWVELVGLVGYDQARPAEGLALARAADAAVTRAGDPPLSRARLLHHQSMVLSYQGELEAAIAREREALAIREKAAGADDLLVADSLNNLARLSSLRGDYAGAEAIHRRALPLRRAALGDAHPLVADSLNNLGVVIYHQGRLDEAEPLYREALRLRVAALGERHRDVGTTLNNLGGLYLDRGDRAAAEHHLSRALAIWEAALGPDHADLAIPLANLGDLALRRSDFARALALCTRGLAIETRISGADNPELAWNLTCQGEAHLGLAHPRDAVAPLARALALREANPGDAGELAHTRFALARALAAAPGGDPRRARALARQALATFDQLGGVWAPRAEAARRWLASP